MITTGITWALLIGGTYASYSSPQNPNKVLIDILSDVKSYATKRLHETKQPYAPSEFPYFNIFPTHVVSLYDQRNAVTWPSKCFSQNSGYMSVSDDRSRIIITIESDEPTETQLTSSVEKCTDFYMFACAAAHQDIVVHPTHDMLVTTEVTILLPANITDAEWFDIDNKGIRVNLYANDVATTFSNMLETVALFEAEVTGEYTPQSDARNIDFLNHYNHFDPVVAVDPTSFTLPHPSQIHSGTSCVMF